MSNELEEKQQLLKSKQEEEKRLADEVKNLEAEKDASKKQLDDIKPATEVAAEKSQVIQQHILKYKIPYHPFKANINFDQTFFGREIRSLNEIAKKDKALGMAAHAIASHLEHQFNLWMQGHAFDAVKWEEGFDRIKKPENLPAELEKEMAEKIEHMRTKLLKDQMISLERTMKIQEFTFRSSFAARFLGYTSGWTRKDELVNSSQNNSQIAVENFAGYPEKLTSGVYSQGKSDLLLDDKGAVRPLNAKNNFDKAYSEALDFVAIGLGASRVVLDYGSEKAVKPNEVIKLLKMCQQKQLDVALGSHIYSALETIKPTDRDQILLLLKLAKQAFQTKEQAMQQESFRDKLTESDINYNHVQSKLINHLSDIEKNKDSPDETRLDILKNAALEVKYQRDLLTQESATLDKSHPEYEKYLEQHQKIDSKINELANVIQNTLNDIRPIVISENHIDMHNDIYQEIENLITENVEQKKGIISAIETVNEHNVGEPTSDETMEYQPGNGDLSDEELESKYDESEKIDTDTDTDTDEQVEGEESTPRRRM